MQQFRFADSIAFNCFRCGESKKSKLITVYGGDWSRRLCNGCYGRLLSLYEIKAGTGTKDEIAEKLADLLLTRVGADAQRQAERLLHIAEHSATRLAPESLRFVATSEYVAGQLQADPQLEWSPAVIGLCKAVEMEVVARIVVPLSLKVAGEDLAYDLADKDMGRVAQFCADSRRKPPELGALAHFLQTATHSRQRRDSSTLLRGLLRLSADWSGSHWVFEPSGLHHSLTSLTAEFRNKAAHIDEMGRDDYLRCRELVIGPKGILWKILDSTEKRT